MLKKWVGISVIRIFEQIVKLTDGNKDFYNTQDFPFVKILEANADKIRKEYLKVASNTYIPKFQEVSIEQEKLTNDDSWLSYLLTVYGNDLIEHRERCPVTTACLNHVPLMTTALFSVLKPGKSIPPHRGAYSGVLRCHLALIIPDETKCEITLNGKSKNWEEGKCLIFDDTFIHSACNMSAATRVVLFIDFMRPLPFPLNYLNFWLLQLIAGSEFIGEILERSHHLDGVKIRKREIRF
ncbi:MAG: aspartyl/asparaginyl beta-hydroxylase domain-containing protein [Chitinophagales bacterium]|nr:aspartyl/asparaginyl beta-hydroxylase domain-containing protein [Chitinophagales bacterium]